MHTTLEGVQRSATPAISGPLQIAVVLLALGLTLTAPTRLSQTVALLSFLGLSVQAVGLKPLRWLSVPVAFLLPGVAVILLATPGRALLTAGPLTVTDAGLQTAGDTLVRSLSALAIMTFLVATTPVPTVLATLRRAGLPDVLVELFLYVYRAIASLMASAERTHTAATARLGYRTRRGALRTASLVAANLFVRTIDRVQRVDEAMRARAYAGEPPGATVLESHGYPYAVAVLALLVGVRFV